MTPEDLHRTEVIRRVRNAIARDAKDLHSILAYCEGADPVLVAECIASTGFAETPISDSPTTYTR